MSDRERMLPVSATMTAHGGDVPYYSFPALDAVPFVRHGFSTRLGGVSTGKYASMNLSFTRGDDPAAVREDFDRFCAVLGFRAEDTVISAQTHTTNLYIATGADRGRGITFERGYTDVDGLITAEPGVLLCTQYADCVPLFFADPVRRVVAVSHAGWRGTVAGMARCTVERMHADFGCEPKDIVAGIGPSIGGCCFEVDPPVTEEFRRMPGFEERFVRPGIGDKAFIDLKAVNRRIMLDAGLTDEHITVSDLCTKCHPDTFWSHRVCGKDRGSLAGFIALTD